METCLGLFALINLIQLFDTYEKKHAFLVNRDQKPEPERFHRPYVYI